MKQERRAATERFLAMPRTPLLMPLTCTCRSFRYPHELSEHKKLRSDYDWRSWEERA